MKEMYKNILGVVLALIIVTSESYTDQLKGKQSRHHKFLKKQDSVREEMVTIKKESLGKSALNVRDGISRSLRKAPAPSTVNSFDPGTLDSTFGVSGSRRVNITDGAFVWDEAHAVAIQPDGKIVTAGYSLDATFTYVAFAVARFDTSGTPDNSFGNFGSTLIPISGSIGTDFCYALALQPDGKIVTAGTSSAEAGSDTVQMFAVARFNSDGSPDNTFGSGGSARINIAGGGDDAAFSVAVKSNGKIVLGGYSDDLSGNIAFGLAQFNEDGTPDSTFGTNGTVRIYIDGSGGYEDDCASLAIQSDGKIIAAGYSADPVDNWAFAVARFHSNGTLDSTFGTNGSATTFIDGGIGFDDEATSVVIQPDGKIVTAGYSADADTFYAFAVARFDSTGTIDNTFGTSGTTRASINGGDNTDDEGASVALQQDGKIIVAGSSSANFGYMGFAVARFETDGTLDNTFGPGGSVRSYVNSFEGGGEIYDPGYATAIQSDGKIVVAGFSSDIYFNTAFFVARLLGSSEDPLPVELSSLNIEYRSPNVELRWKTVTELNNAGWEVERASLNPSKGGTSEVPQGGIWGAVGFVEGNGNTNSPKEYLFTDRNLKAGKYSYRLKQIDNNGKFKYSQEVEVVISQMPQIFSLMQNYPNPFNPTTTIGFTLQVSGMTTLKIYDAIGREVAMLVDENLEAGVYHQRTFNASNLSSGIYFAKLSAAEKMQIKKLMLIK